MTSHTNLFKKYLFLLQILFIFSCSTGVIKVQKIPDTANVSYEINSFENAMHVATINQVNILSPNNFHKAQDCLASAKESLTKQKESKHTLHDIAVGRAYLKRANEVADIAHDNIEPIVLARQDAISAGASKYFATDFNKADNKLKSATSYFEYNNFIKANKNRDQLLTSYQDLELRAIKYNNLERAENTIAQAIKDGARKKAPRALEIAEKKVRDTNAYITANRHEEDQIRTKSIDTLLSAEQLFKLTHDSLDEQHVGAAQALVDEVSARESSLRKEQEKNDLLDTEEEEDLKSEKEINDMLEKAGQEFSPDEAEVFKQGKTITVRLQGLAFKSSKTDVNSSNLLLLRKVKNVINNFKPSSVIIEGHTDSYGSKMINRSLSTKRAEAVKAYFIENGTIAEDKIQAIGYGEDKPLATNATVMGRAQNRRVDININLDKKQKL